MAFLAKILGGLFGSQAATITIPVLALAALVFAHQWKQNYDGRLYAQATNVCDTRWKAAVRQQERDAARQDVVAARALLEGERRVNEDLKNEISKVNADYQAALATSNSPDPKCLSPGVLELLAGSPSKSGNASRPGR